MSEVETECGKKNRKAHSADQKRACGIEIRLETHAVESSPFNRVSVLEKWRGKGGV